ncbi:hypothetical protein [Luteolibacter sp. AS25]|uniref:hypothetical protein n=1 Tax=Luteolibacter sp. AS25 TaxID=3135776 RepID=UPI00398B5D55
MLTVNLVDQRRWWRLYARSTAARQNAGGDSYPVKRPYFPVIYPAFFMLECVLKIIFAGFSAENFQGKEGESGAIKLGISLFLKLGIV